MDRLLPRNLRDWLALSGRGRIGRALAAILLSVMAMTAIPPRAPAQEASSGQPDRLRMADENGKVFVGRQYGPSRAKLALLPDGRLMSILRPVYTDEPFQPLTIDQLRERLSTDEFRGFQVEQTQHYLVFYQSSPEFARDSAILLESLYKKLTEKLREKGLPIQEAEFPLVAVIFRTEEEFRAQRKIDDEVQAYYEIYSNRIFLFEEPTRKDGDQQILAMRKPQTVTHEGTHQILQNVGVQPRLGAWPIWLVEGLAELAAASNRKNGEWVEFSQVNPLHLATLEDLRDANLLQTSSGSPTPVNVGREPGTSLVEYLITRTDLRPTDYALSWALTHYLANKQTPAFLQFLLEMGQVEPGIERTVEENKEVFIKYFGSKFRLIDQAVDKHLSRLRSQTKLVYYGVTFEQQLPANRVRRATLVSRSPQLIQEWATVSMPLKQGGPYEWHVFEFATRAEAINATSSWLHGN